ncbi:hypothetical protein EDB80DRAFT_693499 [Ilyonectria destructans]|nr:hypothetical protein EDB80DRAFT_693499 [Ilyonectria destructans]
MGIVIYYYIRLCVLLCCNATLEQDYVFIVVPDSWNFLDKGVSGSGSPTPPPGAAISAIRSSSSGYTPFEEIKAKFTTRRPAVPSTPLPAATATPALTPSESMPSVISTPFTRYHYLSTSPTPKRPTSGVDYTPPAKRPCQPPTSPTTIPSLGTYPSAGSSSSPETVDKPEPSCGGTQPPTSSFMRPLASATYLPVPTPVLDTIMAAVLESSNRPSRNRHPLKNKYLEEVSKV